MKMAIRQIVIVWIAITLPMVATARDYSSMYPQEKLLRTSKVYGKNIHGMLYEDIKRQLLGREQATLDRITLQQPWNRTVDPFEFSASAQDGIVRIPSLSVKFLDDLAIATAWYERHKCNKEAIFDYVAALDFSKNHLPTPLKALQVPDNAYELDSYVDDISQKILKSALAFIILHELGHVHHQHRPYHQITAAQAQQQETQADRFALNILRRMRLPPMGMTVWFMALSMRDPLKEGSPLQTHPLTASRLQAIADTLHKHPDDFIEPGNRGRWDADTIRYIATQFDTIAQRLSDPDLRYLLQQRGRMVTPQLLANACNSKQHRQDWMEMFKSRYQ